MIRVPSQARQLIDRAFAVLAAAVVLAFASMVTLVFIQVVDRFVGIGWFWTEEVVRTLLVWCVMIGLPVVLYRHDEILVDILSVPPVAARWRLRLAMVLSLIFLAILAWQGWTFTARNGAFTSPTLGVSRAWIYASIPLGAALGCLALLLRAEDRAAAWPDEDETEDTGTTATDQSSESLMK
ncbi:TRAP transporter small permease [Fulvimarina sp. MAC8]|uniref:TRAP transporter small permease n=1 Tax=Fulvimarina sp. MAC8 TaxID=3162874 RepID=UPI0032ED258E